MIFALSPVLASVVAPAESQGIHQFVEAGGDRLHFHIVKGSDPPILFEAGGGDDETVWTAIIKPIHEITGATIITYDRAGFGKSVLNAQETDPEEHGINHGIEELQEALQKLGQYRRMMLVAHSYGALYARLFSARHPELVKAVVLVDGSSSCWFTAQWLKTFKEDWTKETAKKPGELGSYYQSLNLAETVNIISKTEYPPAIPIIDLVSEHPPFSDPADVARWKECHHQFVSARSNREGITAYGTGHYIYRDNPPLVIHAIAKAYAGIVERKRANEVLNRDVDYAIQETNRPTGH